MINQDDLDSLLAKENEPDEDNTYGVIGKNLSPVCMEISISTNTIGIESANNVFKRISTLSMNADQHLILNVRDCPFLSSFIIGQLVNIATDRKTRGLRLAIVEANEMILEVLELTNMGAIIEVYPTSDDALKIFDRVL